MGSKLQRTVVAILEECLLVNAQKFFDFLGRYPTGVFGHGVGSSYLYTVHKTSQVSRFVRISLSLYWFQEVYGEIRIS